MGRLGFNLVREKDAAKNVESGLPSPGDAQQNERNEGAEIGELIIACERNRRTIRGLRLLSFCLAIMLICMAAYLIITQSRQYYNDQPKTDVSENLLPEAAKGALIAGSGGLYYEDASTNMKSNDQAASNCTRQVQELEVTRSELERKLESERDEREQFARVSETHFEELRSQFNALSSKYELLAGQERTQSETLEQLRQERAELIQKLEASQRKLQRAAAAARSASTTKMTTTTATPPPTAAPTPAPTPTPQKSNIFDTEQFRKINDLVKDIETVGRLFGSVFDEII